MTQDRRSKRAIRSRMAQTGEKYTAARRALQAPGGEGRDPGDGPGPGALWPQDPVAWFTDQAYNAILLAEDEARMMGHATVDPEHLLLAGARVGNVERLLAGEGIAARQIHGLIARERGVGARLTPQPPRSPASQVTLRRAVAVGAARGVLSPSTEDLLLALDEQEVPAGVLAELGLDDVPALVTASFPTTRAPVEHDALRRRAARLAANGRTPPSPGPIPPVFERFSSPAREAIDAGIGRARDLDDRYVEPAHLLLGVLDGREGVVAAVRSKLGWKVAPVEAAKPAHARATGIFTREARRIVAEDMLVIAERYGHPSLTTGHLLLGLLERPDERCRAIAASLPGTDEMTEAVIQALHEQTPPKHRK